MARFTGTLMIIGNKSFSAIHRDHDLRLVPTDPTPTEPGTLGCTCRSGTSKNKTHALAGFRASRRTAEP
jgi:hypothetical protein